MRNVKILDCTIRDGGYYTNWDFEEQLIDDYFKAMESLPIEYVEIGYRSTPQDNYFGKYFYCPEYIMERAKKAMPSKKLVIILNEKDFQINDIDYLLEPCKKYISLVRLAIDPKNFQRAIDKAKHIKSKGFEVGFNVMYMSTWKENPEFLKELPQINDIVSFFYMVDSFGGIMPKDIVEITHLVKGKTTVPIGFHGHNNMEMGLINSLTAVEAGCEIIDATITGMGRGAGNLKTELLLTYLSAYVDWDISFNELASIVSDFELLQKSYGWGTNLPYMISGANSLPQKDVMSWISKNRYSVSGIVNALQNQKQNSIDNIEIADFSESNSFKKTILIGGGQTALTHFEPIKRIVEENPSDYCIIHASTRYASIYNKIEVPQFYCLVGNEGYRLQKVFDNLSMINHRCILPPSPRKMGTFVPNEVMAHTRQLKEISFIDIFNDSPLTIAIQTGIELKSKEIALVGFDGYDLNLNRTQFELSQENQIILEKANEFTKNLVFWTPTNYKKIKQISVFSLLK